MAAQGKLYGIFSFLQNVGRGLCSLRRRIFCKLGEVYLSEQLYEGTGKRKFLDCMCKFADLICDTFGTEEGKEPGIPGHQEIELGLLRLYEVTGKENYKDLARYFIEQRRKESGYICQEKGKKRHGFTLIWMCITENIIRHMLLSMSRKKQ